MKIERRYFFFFAFFLDLLLAFKIKDFFFKQNGHRHLQNNKCCSTNILKSYLTHLSQNIISSLMFKFSVVLINVPHIVLGFFLHSESALTRHYETVYQA